MFMKRCDFQNYFKERLLELLDYETIDSYRVRSHNSYTLLVELKDLILGWMQKNIKLFDTVAMCIEEVLDAVKKDTCLDFSFYDKECFIQDLEDYHKNGEKSSESRKLLMILNKCIDFNKDKYISKLFDCIEEKIFGNEEIDEKNFSPEIGSLDYNISALCCALLNAGYSKRYLYTTFQKLFKESDFEKTYQKLKKEYRCPNVQTFNVVLKLSSIPQHVLDANIPELEMSFSYNGNSNKMVDDYLRLKTHDRLFVVKDCEAMDAQSATKKAMNKLNTFLDYVQLVVNKLKIDIPKKALVVSGDYAHLRSTGYMFDGVYSDNISLATEFKKHLEEIRKNSSIEQGVKDRIYSALRHLRVGNCSTELEQRFINYWIALEFLFSSPESSTTTFNRIKENLPMILTSCYVKRNLYALNQCLIEKNLISSGDCYWEKSDLDQFINSVDSIVLKYKLKCMKSNLHNKEKTKEYIKAHERNLKWHIARIYRVRNELIHEAALTQEIEGITSNLRYYLVFVLNQMIVFFANAGNNMTISIDDFYNEYFMIKSKISKSYGLETLIAVPLELDLLK